MDYPAAPWNLTGQMWLSVFRIPEKTGPLRPPGVYGVAFVRYEEPSPLTYGELLVARPVNAGSLGRRISITDIWVDSPASRAGGRELWGIPKELCDFTQDTSRRGPLTHTEWSAGAQHPIARARFDDVSRAAPRVPMRAGIWQPAIEDTRGLERTAPLSGSARAMACRARWDFAPDGPLGWLAGRRSLASFRLTDFRLSFG
ncbi:acetoacetate decarboxylase family protein [Nocardioides pantholopis]|uniref:acetoacetate decarboxylase family protein n=1 Tax=Nocardioides pantholopis TaxID=2483798 RepID=UPI000F07CD54|nr:acetoacetate decarboxylase family protein [Nocardioides pantholopis]